MKEWKKITERLKLVKLECEECGAPLKIVPEVANTVVCSQCGTVYIGIIVNGKMVLDTDELKKETEKKIKEVEKVIVKEKIVKVPVEVPVREPQPPQPMFPPITTDQILPKIKDYWLKYTPYKKYMTTTSNSFSDAATSFSKAAFSAIKCKRMSYP